MLQRYHCPYRVTKMKFFAVIILFYGIVGLIAPSANASSSSFPSDFDGTLTSTEVVGSTTSTSAPALKLPCGPVGRCGNKLYFFY